MTATDLRDTFLRESKDLQDALRDANDARGKQHLKTSTKDSVLELVHLRVTALFETFLEDLLFQCLDGSSGIPGLAPKVSAGDPALLHELVLSDGNFISLSRFTDLARKAGSLMDGGPFSRLDYRDQDRDALAEYVIVRNAIAHSSGPAREKFDILATKKKYVAQRPAQYLSSIVGDAEEGEIAIARLRALSHALTCATEADAIPYLQPERVFGHASQPKAGTYACKANSHTKVTTGEKLGHCPTCPPVPPCSDCGRKAATTQWVRIVG